MQFAVSEMHFALMPCLIFKTVSYRYVYVFTACNGKVGTRCSADQLDLIQIRFYYGL